VVGGNNQYIPGLQFLESFLGPQNGKWAHLTKHIKVVFSHRVPPATDDDSKAAWGPALIIVQYKPSGKSFA
jgi:hypothetical protein